jgi:hypothetical protein
MKTRRVKYLEIVQAEYASGHKIHLTFSDGMVRVIDFEPFLRKALNPDITKYRQLRNFKKFHLHHGDLMWGDFDMIFPLNDLYDGTILKGEAAASAQMVLNDAIAPARSARVKKAKASAPVSYRKRPTPKRKNTLQHV